VGPLPRVRPGKLSFTISMADHHHQIV
jgi:hypothetical protein